MTTELSDIVNTQTTPPSRWRETLKRKAVGDLVLYSSGLATGVVAGASMALPFWSKLHGSPEGDTGIFLTAYLGAYVGCVALWSAAGAKLNYDCARKAGAGRIASAGWAAAGAIESAIVSSYVGMYGAALGMTWVSR